MAGAEQDSDEEQRQDPDGEPDGGCTHRPHQRNGRQRGRDGASRRRPQVAGECSGGDDQRKRQREDEYCDERRSGDDPVSRTVQRAPSDADQRLEHDRQHGGLHADEQRLDRRGLPVRPVHDRQRQHEQRARHDEQQPGGEAALGAVQAPASVGRELHRLRPRQQHAEAQSRQECALAEPAALLDQDFVHQGDLRRGAAERQQPDLAEDAQRLAKRGYGGWLRGGGG